MGQIFFGLGCDSGVYKSLFFETVRRQYYPKSKLFVVFPVHKLGINLPKYQRMDSLAVLTGDIFFEKFLRNGGQFSNIQIEMK